MAEDRTSGEEQFPCISIHIPDKSKDNNMGVHVRSKQEINGFIATSANSRRSAVDDVDFFLANPTINISIVRPSS